MFFQAKTKLWDSYCNPVETVSIGASQAFCQSQILRTRNTRTHTHTPKQRQLPCPYYEASAKVFLTLFIYMCCKQLSGTKTVTCSPKNAPTKNPKCRNLRISAVFLKSKIGTSTSLPLMSCFKLSSTACLPKWMGE